MAYSLKSYFKFDLSVARKRGYRVGNPLALYEYSESGNPAASLWLTFRPDAEKPGHGVLQIKGTIYGQPVHDHFDMVQVASNLGTPGGQWYFVCDQTNQRCRTLYFNGKGLVSRQALGGVLYRCQQYSRKDRQLWKIFDPEVKKQIMVRDWLNKPRTRKYYQGKPTRQTKRWIKNYQRLLSLQPTDLNRLI